MIKASIGALCIGAALVAVTPATASANGSRDVYVSDYVVGTVSVFETDSSGQLLTSSATTATESAEGIAFSPDGRFLYSGAYTTGDITAFSVAADGSLTQLPGASVSNGDSAVGLTVTPDGRFLFAPDGDDQVVGYAIAADGTLSPTPTTLTTVTGAGTLFGVVASPDAKSLYVVDQGLYQVHAFTVGADGSLTEMTGSPLATGESPYSAQITPDGTKLYVGNYGTNDVSGYSVGADGTLSELAGSPYQDVEGPYAGMAIGPDGRRLYVSDYNGGNVTSLAIGADGALTPVGAPVAAGAQTNGLAVSPNGKYLYAAAGGAAQAVAFAIQPDGSLAANGSPQPLAAGGYADFQSVAIRPNQPPTARLSTKTVMGVTTLDASASSDSDGSVVSYAWNFGDGTSATSTTPTVQHTYADGARQATVTLTDDEGCSTTRVVTGLSALCNGSAVAGASTSLVAGIAGVTVSAKRAQKQRHALKVAVNAGAAESVRVDIAGFAKVRGIPGKVALKAANGTAVAGTMATFKLRAKNKAQGTAVVGHRGRAVLTVTLTDADGYVVTRTIRVKLR